MKKFKEEGIIYKTSRISYISNYLLATLIIILFLLISLNFKLSFTLFPKTTSELISTVVSLGFFVIIVALIEEPTIERILRHYIITNNEVIKVEGIIRKKRISIPYQSVADVKVIKGIIGRIFNFGDIEIAGMKESIRMKGIRNPEEAYRIIQSKISITRVKRKEE